ncbi:MAG: SPFH domain-containing protein [Limosilactobacillus oris]
MKEKNAFHINGYLAFLLTIIVALVAAWLVYRGLTADQVGLTVIGAILLVLVAVAATSLTIIQPNEAKALTFFGNYIGTIRDAGLFLTVPFTEKERVSLRVGNFNSQILKVNDSQGNPVEIAAVIVYRVVDTAKALFAVDDYEQFVQIQSESAVRHVASEYPYDTFEDEDALTLRSNPTEVSDRLTAELQERLNVAGVEIIETRLTHLAYATEIASAMLQKQQSAAILSARKIIVEGAVSITEDAIDRLARETELDLTDAQRLQIINNIMVAIVSERGTQPVINTGTSSFGRASRVRNAWPSCDLGPSTSSVS